MSTEPTTAETMGFSTIYMCINCGGKCSGARTSDTDPDEYGLLHNSSGRAECDPDRVARWAAVVDLVGLRQLLAARRIIRNAASRTDGNGPTLHKASDDAVTALEDAVGMYIFNVIECAHGRRLGDGPNQHGAWVWAADADD